MYDVTSLLLLVLVSVALSLASVVPTGATLLSQMVLISLFRPKDGILVETKK